MAPAALDGNVLKNQETQVVLCRQYFQFDPLCCGRGLKLSVRRLIRKPARERRKRKVRQVSEANRRAQEPSLKNSNKSSVRRKEIKDRREKQVHNNHTEMDEEEKE